MDKEIKIRRSFLDVDPEVAYEPYKLCDMSKMPDFSNKTNLQSIVLKNERTGDLEKLFFKIVGGIPFATRDGYDSVWGDIVSNDRHVCLVFYFDTHGVCEKVSASFCGRNPAMEDLKPVLEKIKYGAEITVYDLHYRDRINRD